MIKVSVIIIAYNRENYLSTCLNSIIQQTYKNFEIIYIDDGSTDRSLEVVENYKKKTDIRLLKNEKNLGVCKSRNKGIIHSQGELIGFIDSDCEAMPNWLEQIILKFETENLDAVSGSVRDLPARNFYEEALCGTAIIGKGQLQGRLIVGCNMFFRKEALNGLIFDESLCGADDDDIQVCLEQKNKKIGVITEKLLIHNHPLKNWRSFLEMTSIRGKSKAQFCYKHNRIPKDLILILLAIPCLALALINKAFINIFLLLVFLQLIAIIYNEIYFKEKSTFQTLNALPILTFYHFLKAFYFTEKTIEIIFHLDKPLIKSKQTWQKHIKNSPSLRALPPPRSPRF